MKQSLVLALTMVALNASAESFVTRIHSIESGSNFIRLENGRVAFLNGKRLPSLPEKALVQVRLDPDGRLLKIKELPETRSPQLKSLETQEPPPYSPTVIPSYEDAKKIFEHQRSDWKRVSECSDRAHVWAYDEFKRSGTMSQKVFAFFTASYINRNKFKWWFHVAPLIQVKRDGKVQGMVLDHRYLDRPVPIKEWTDLLVFSKRPCKMTTKFSEYDVNPQTEDCYMMIDSMYYRLPGDLHAQELKGTYRDRFFESEVNFSRRMAFEGEVVRSSP